MTENPAYTIVGECPINDCLGQLVVFKGPIFGQRSAAPTCSMCGYKQAPRKDGTVYISWDEL